MRTTTKASSTLRRRSYEAHNRHAWRRLAQFVYLALLQNHQADAQVQSIMMSLSPRPGPLCVAYQNLMVETKLSARIVLIQGQVNGHSSNDE